MSKQYPGGVISKTPPVPSGPFANSTAPGVWTLEQQAAYAKQGNWPTAGNVNPDSFIENLFQTWLYNGTGATQTITNGIDLAGKGGLVWRKSRTQPSGAGFFHVLNDTTRGVLASLYTNTTDAQVTSFTALSTFNSNGFTMMSGAGAANQSGDTYTSWTFREQPKFFDVVTWTANGSSNQEVSHSLASVPGCIIVKRTDSTSDWFVWHRKNGLADSTTGLSLNGTGAAFEQSWNIDGIGWISSTMFKPASGLIKNAAGSAVPTSGTYVAYVFAHNAGGFGLTGTDNVISCGSYTGNGSATGPVVTLGYEPQWVMVKRTDSTSNWTMFDTMRGMSQTSANLLYANLSDDEGIGTQGWVVPNATGFQLAINQSSVNASGGTYIYIAIRRGPMAVPTTGTSVFDAVTYSGDSTSNRLITSPSFPTDLMVGMARNQTRRKYFWDRLRGASVAVDSTTTDAEYSTGTALSLTSVQNGFVVTDNGAPYTNTSGNNYDSLCFRRAPGFFDEVCYTGTGSGVPNTVAHNLAVAPELIIFKLRSSVSDWPVLGVSGSISMALNANFASPTYGTFPLSSVSSTSFTTGSGYTGGGINDSGSTIVAYLFATCPGVSKVGSYTGNGTTQVINCGFTAGSRFVLIKRTDSTGDWYVWDSARGIVAGNDPYLLLNSTAAEVTTTDAVDTDPTGFVVNRLVAVDINENGGTYIFLAIA